MNKPGKPLSPKTKLFSPINMNRKYRVPPIKLGLYPKRTPAENRLINKNPFGDRDKDKVMNWFDCRPSKRKLQDFGPFKYQGREVESFTAAERFGGANIKRLKRLGAGRDRVVYQLDKNKVLKLAKNPTGLKQNEPERDLDNYLGYIKHYETGKDYVVMEKAEKPGKETKAFLKRLREVGNEPPSVRSGWSGSRRPISWNEYVTKKQEALRNTLEKEGHSDLLNYDYAEGDITKKSSWGEKAGKPVLIDAGGLSKEGIRSEHRVTKVRERLGMARSQRAEAIKELAEGNDFYKERLPKINRDIAQMEEEIKEWNEIQQARKQFKGKGEKPEYREDIEPTSESPEVLEALDTKEDVEDREIREALDEEVGLTKEEMEEVLDEPEPQDPEEINDETNEDEEDEE
jgi:hypothetical protein